MPLITNGTNVEDAIIKILTTKSKQWKHEQEVRYLVNIGETLHAHIRRVFAGCKMSVKNYEELEKLVSQINGQRSTDDQIQLAHLLRENIDYGWAELMCCD